MSHKRTPRSLLRPCRIFAKLRLAERPSTSHVTAGCKNGAFCRFCFFPRTPRGLLVSDAHSSAGLSLALIFCILGDSHSSEGTAGNFSLLFCLEGLISGAGIPNLRRHSRLSVSLRPGPTWLGFLYNLSGSTSYTFFFFSPIIYDHKQLRHHGCGNQIVRFVERQAGCLAGRYPEGIPESRAEASSR